MGILRGKVGILATSGTRYCTLFPEHRSHYRTLTLDRQFRRWMTFCAENTNSYVEDSKIEFLTRMVHLLNSYPHKNSCASGKTRGPAYVHLVLPDAHKLITHL